MWHHPLQRRDTTDVHVRERNGFVFQHYALFRHMTVFENVAFGLRVKPARAPERSADQEKVMTCSLVQLDWLAERYPSQLSAASASASPWPRPGGGAQGAAARRALRRARRQGAGTAPLAAPPARRSCM